MPLTIAPQLAELVKAPPEGSQWIHEIKWDGYRMLLRVDNGNVRIISRHGREWTDTFGAVARAAGKLRIRNAWIDGEVVAIDKRGRVSFQELQNAARSRKQPARVMFYAFDLLYLNGADLRSCPLLDRKAQLERVMGGASPELAFTRHYAGRGADYYREACHHELEGIVSKRADSRYVSGRVNWWRKTKREQRERFVVGGFTRPPGMREGFTSLLLGEYTAGRLSYVGRVKMGFDSATLRTLGAELNASQCKTAPFADAPAKADVRWVTPNVVADVAYLERTRDRSLRHASFRGICEPTDMTGA